MPSKNFEKTITRREKAEGEYPKGKKGKKLVKERPVRISKEERSIVGEVHNTQDTPAPETKPKQPIESKASSVKTSRARIETSGDGTMKRYYDESGTFFKEVGENYVNYIHTTEGPLKGKLKEKKVSMPDRTNFYSGTGVLIRSILKDGTVIQTPVKPSTTPTEVIQIGDKKTTLLQGNTSAITEQMPTESASWEEVQKSTEGNPDNWDDIIKANDERISKSAKEPSPVEADPSSQTQIMGNSEPTQIMSAIEQPKHPVDGDWINPVTGNKESFFDGNISERYFPDGRIQYFARGKMFKEELPTKKRRTTKIETPIAPTPKEPLMRLNTYVKPEGGLRTLPKEKTEDAAGPISRVEPIEPKEIKTLNEEEIEKLIEKAKEIKNVYERDRIFFELGKNAIYSNQFELARKTAENTTNYSHTKFRLFIEIAKRSNEKKDYELALKFAVSTAFSNLNTTEVALVAARNRNKEIAEEIIEKIKETEKEYWSKNGDMLPEEIKTILDTGKGTWSEGRYNGDEYTETNIDTMERLNKKIDYLIKQEEVKEESTSTILEAKVDNIKSPENWTDEDEEKLKTILAQIEKNQQLIEKTTTRLAEIDTELAEIKAKKKESAVMGSETLEIKTFSTDFIKKEIKPLLEKLKAVKKVKDIEVVGEGEKIKIILSVVGQKGIISTDIDANIVLETTNGSIVIKNYEIKASLFPNMVSDAIAPHLEELPELVKSHIEKEEGKKVEKIEIENGQLKVSFEK